MHVTACGRRLLAPLIVAIVAGRWAVAQEPAPARFTLDGFSGDGIIELTYAWAVPPGRPILPGPIRTLTIAAGSRLTHACRLVCCPVQGGRELGGSAGTC